MSDTLKWRVVGEEFEDGSRLSEWTKIESHPWMWQYDTHELTFDIYEHEGQYWKLYRSRWVAPGKTDYSYGYGYGGQVCSIALVEYLTRARSPHSNVLKEAGDLEWVRVYEVDPEIHCIVKAAARLP